jgi:2-phosphosulfolactate phosphatase
MNLHVDLSPKTSYGGVVIVIDVLRSATVAAMLFERGLEQRYLSPSIRRAQGLAEAKGLLLLGERDGLPPEGFNYGGSPHELFSIDAHGKSAVLVAMSSPLALAQTAEAHHVLLGSFYNAAAVAEEAAALAQGEITVLCCGYRGEEDLDDTLCAGYITAQLKRRFPEATLSGAALFSLSLLKAFPDPTKALWGSRVGQRLRRLNLTDDIGISSLVSQTEVVPRLEPNTDDETQDYYRFSALTAR